MKKAVILGANGNIAREVSKNLHEKGLEIRQFSRNPKKVSPEDEIFPGDILNPESVKKAVEGVDVAFLLIGIQYKASIWEKNWPIIMRNTLDACIASQVKLVFFDNMYALDPEKVAHLTEETPLLPKSRKGKVRKKILDMLWAEVQAGKLTGMVVRAADFYGPGASNSFLEELVIKRMKAGKGPQWLYSGSKKHSFTYIPDAGKATAFLAFQSDAWNQSWNLPTDSTYPSVEEIVAMLNQELGLSKNLQVMPPFLIWLLSFFIPVMGEVRELSYQLSQDYCFDSSKIQKAFGLSPTPFKEGLRSCL